MKGIISERKARDKERKNKSEKERSKSLNHVGTSMNEIPPRGPSKRPRGPPRLPSRVQSMDDVKKNGHLPNVSLAKPKVCPLSRCPHLVHKDMVESVQI
jgi:hypothetical protein